MGTDPRESLQEEIKKCLVRWDTRVPDWDTFGWQEEADPKYHRAQRRYIGMGAAGRTSDPTALEPTSFTLSVMEIPPGNVGPMHDHVENEYFFVLEGTLTMIWERDGVVVEEVVGPRDCLFCPPGILRGLRNDTDQPAFLQVLIDVTKPTLPHYPAGSVLEDLREKRQSAQQRTKAED